MQQMPQNPYAAPIAAGQSGGGGGLGAAQDWEIGEVLTQAWETFKSQWVVLVFAPLVAMAIPTLISTLGQGFLAFTFGEDSIVAIIATFVLLIGQYLVSAYFQVGINRIMVAAARGQTPNFSDLFSGADRMVPMFFLYLLMGLAVGLGMVLLIVPGIILALGLAMGMFFVSDQDEGPVDALRSSWERTDGHKIQLLIFGLAAMVLTFLGLLACLVGIFVTGPVLSVAFAIIYTRLTGTTDGAGATSGFAPPTGGAPPYGSPPGAGYAPQAGPPPGAPPHGASPAGYGAQPPAGYGAPPPGTPPGSGVQPPASPQAGYGAQPPGPPAAGLPGPQDTPGQPEAVPGAQPLAPPGSPGNNSGGGYQGGGTPTDGR